MVGNVRWIYDDLNIIDGLTQKENKNAPLSSPTTKEKHGKPYKF